MKRKKLITGFGFVVFLLSMSFSFFSPPQVSADFQSRCAGFSRLNRPGCHGYFKGTNYHGRYGIQGQNIIDCNKAPSTCTNGESLNNAIPANVNTANEFIAWVQKSLRPGTGTGYDYNKAGAAFIVDAMLGRWGTDYDNPSQGIAYAQQNFNRWADAVRYYEAAGRISWNWATTIPTGTINSMHACWPSIPNCEPGNILSHDSQDFAFYKNPGPEPSHLITFTNPDGSTFQIRRECANLVGQVRGLTMPDFDLTPAVGATVNGASTTAAEPGDTVRFTYTVNNSGSMSSGSTSCNTYANTYGSYHTAAASPVPGGPAGPNPGCPRNFAAGTITTVATEQFVITTGNQTICRSLFVNPASYGGGQEGDETCVFVANKPYLRVFGGDISVGNGLSTASTCPTNTNAAVTSWNRGNANSYTGAGVQYAAYALRNITYFATSQGNAGGPNGTNLSFANTSTNVNAGNYGGNWGSASCIPDYWSRRPATAQGPQPNVSSMTSGAYYYPTGGISFPGGTVNPGEKISVYVNGDIFITSSITYAGAWNASNIPLFELVVRGNIYISGSVTRLDGVYISQRNTAANTGGTIYTCATGIALPQINQGQFYNGCTNKLAVNGAFVANNVEFLRTGGTLSQSTSDGSTNASGGGNSAAEVFNFNPSVWMVQPLDGSGRVDNYDAITSLPPVL